MGTSGVQRSRGKKNPFNNSMQFPNLEKTSLGDKKQISKESRTKNRGEGMYHHFQH